MKLIPPRKPLGFALLSLLSVLTHSAAAATLTVNNLNDSGAGSLRQALSGAAATGDEIVFAAGVTGTITLTSGELSFNKSVTITGPGAANLTISGNNASRVFSVSSGTITLSGLRIANGRITGNPNANFGGGGIYNNNGKLTVRNCEIVNNVQFGGDPNTSGFSMGGQGGGIWHVTGGGVGGGWLLLQNCLLSGNMAVGSNGTDGVSPNGNGGDAASAQGGALFIWPQSVNSVTLQDCILSNNAAIGGVGGNGMGTGTRGRGGRGQGGAVFIESYTVLVAQRCTFSNNDATGGHRGAGNNTASSNSADGQGGAFYVLGYAAITGCTLEGNEATGGPGIDGTSLTGALGQGGGLYFGFGGVNLTGSTVINNVAQGGAGGTGGGATSSGEGGGLFIRYNGNQATLNVNNSTIASNLAAGGNAASAASGGGIWTEDTLNVNNSTVAFNSVSSATSENGGGIRVSGGATTLRNTLVAENVAEIGAPDASGPIAPASSYNLIGIGSGVGMGVTGITDGASNNQIGTSAAPIDPKLHAPAFNGGQTMTCSLDADSPAVNAGNDAIAPAVDQRGCLRLGVSDIGAFEFLGVGPALKILSITRIGNGPIVLEGLGVPNALHRIQVSPDLSSGSFFDLDFVTADAGGPLHYEDAAAGLTKRFYRLAFP